MKIMLKNVKFPPHLNLGFIANDKSDFHDRDFKIKAWAPKKARSFTIVSQRWGSYGGGLEGHVEIAYFTTADEGEIKL